MTTKRGEQACAMEGLGLAGGEARSLTGGTAPTPQHSMQPTLWSWWRDVVTGGQRREFGSHQSTEHHCNYMEAGVSSRRRMSAEEKSSDGDRNLHLGMFHSIPGLYVLDLSLQTFPSVLGEANVTSRSEPLL